MPDAMTLSGVIGAGVLRSDGILIAGSLPIETFEGSRSRFWADAGHYRNLNRYSTGSNELRGSIVSIPNVEHRPEEYPFCIVNANGRRERLYQQARVASAVRAASF